ncbi:ATPase [Leptospira hartskeerlii]|uniref:ATPase n=1 Tax=Leptospira hartskeerlii TaxID=2023177 RepID=A0A2M9XGV2_9LEPT|nr:SRPBCC domain-containing protein [Leptospira hartskeerlii]PJZ26903.1 ATPase [Leptospira hartskeerlii]PJZ34615.1 ATPase [Leptospira hartskeerlii]
MKADLKELKVELRGEREVVATRYFAAPRQLVFDCFTKPELMLRWLTGPEGWTLKTIENDLRVGGKYLYVFADQNGTEMGVYGKFLEVIIPEKVANDENYATDMSTFNPNGPENPDATVESRTFTTEGDLTLMTHVVKFASAEVREMEIGAVEAWKDLCLVLDKLLAELVG